MPDEQDGCDSTGETNLTNPMVLYARGPANDDQHNAAKQSGEANNDPEYFRESKVKRKWQEFSNAGVDRYIELALTFAIVIFAGCQLAVTYMNSRTSTEQMKQIIASAQSLNTSADRVDDAAESFSKSSADISRSMGDAVSKLRDQAKATSAANKIAEDATEMEVSGYNPYLEITDIEGHNILDELDLTVGNQPTIFFVNKNKISFQFYLNNTGPGEAKDIYYAVSGAHRLINVRTQQAAAYQISDAINKGERGVNKAVSFGDLEGHTKSTEPVVITTPYGVDPLEMLHHDTEEWFYGELYWSSEIGTPHGWKRVFCFVIRAANGGEVITPCGIHEEGVFPLEKGKKQRRQK